MFDDAREVDKSWSSVKRRIIGLLLAWDVPVKLSLRNSTNDKYICLHGNTFVGNAKPEHSLGNKSFNLPLICSVLLQAGYIEYQSKESWIKMSARTRRVTIQGALSLQPAPSKHAQFISLGVQYISPEVEGNILYDEINRIFAASRFGQQEDISDADNSVKERRVKDKRFKHDGPTQRQLKGGVKGVDRWPMFVIRIKLHNDDDEYATHDGFQRVEKENTITTIVEVLGTMVTSFLEEHHFKPHTRGRRKRHRSVGEVCPGKTSLGLTSLEIAACLPRPASQSRSSSTKATYDVLSSKVHNGNFDANMKFPPPIQDQHIGCGDAFSGWRRIKSGNRSSEHDDFYRNSCNRKSCPVIEQQSEGKCNQTFASYKAGSHTNVENGLEAAQGSGTITADFDILANALLEESDGGDLALMLAEERPEMHEFTQNQGTHVSDGDEELVEWTNPVSRTTFLVSSRTGHVIPKPINKRSKTRDECSPHSPVVSDTDSNSGQKSCFSTPRKRTNPETGSWVRDLLNKWENPVFRRQEENIVQISLNGLVGESSSVIRGRQHRCSDTDISKAFADASSSIATRLSKKGLLNADIISQVDKKFILVKIIEDPINTADVAPIRNELLVLIDQHAADERIRIETLLRDLCSKPTVIPPFQSSLGYGSSITTTVLTKAISYQIQPREISLFETHASYFAYWGVLYDLNLASSLITVKTLPSLIAERCRADPKILMEFLRGEIWKRDDLGLTFHPSTSDNTLAGDDWRTRIGNCPQGLLDMLNSRACRSAIMFNDELGVEECRELVTRLAQCSFPFICAHGRPSMIPLLDMGALRIGS